MKALQRLHVDEALSHFSFDAKTQMVPCIKPLPWNRHGSNRQHKAPPNNNDFDIIKNTAF